MAFSDIPIITSEYLTDEVRREVLRTWRERLFSWPWRPWVTTKTVITHEPSKRVLMFNGKLVIHPAALESLDWMRPR